MIGTFLIMMCTKARGVLLQIKLVRLMRHLLFGTMGTALYSEYWFWQHTGQHLMADAVLDSTVFHMALTRLI